MPNLILRQAYDFETMANAAEVCFYRKRFTDPALNFARHYERNIIDLTERLNSRTYEIGRSYVFVKTRPKPREVWAGDVEARIVQTAFCLDIEPFFYGRMIDDTYSCIPGRGNLAAALRAAEFAKRITEDWTVPAYYGQGDFQNYFLRINQDIAWRECYEPFLGSPDDSVTAWAVHLNLFHDPTTNPIWERTAPFHLVPPPKRRLNCPPRTGVCLGNRDKQLCGNLYVAGLDHYMKHVLHCRYYVRYVDDVIMFSRDKDELRYWFTEMDNWLRTNRGIYLHPDKQHTASVYSGFNFVGTRVRPYHNLPRLMTTANMFRAVRELERLPYSRHLLASVNSYLGLMRQADAFMLRKEICRTLSGYGFRCDSAYTKLFR